MRRELTGLETRRMWASRLQQTLDFEEIEIGIAAVEAQVCLHGVENASGVG